MPGKCNAANPTLKSGARRGSTVRTAASALVLALFAGAMATASADILRSPEGGFTVKEREGAPTRGQSQSAVIRQHGEPEQRHATVGDPPITRWDYADFSVFFEGEYVLHSAVRNGSRSDRP
ncbi:hypothetical protein TVD_06450 [Thioalkalivibrio versutus]|uniref:Phosphodiesterase n=1 Tax=Thioalkalivibrio versutus TaxID=106634 RepID=A0A0G3G685_9GAMM|nr:MULTISPECIES: hypothetical protein [Thioalkalivibrio]AKJ95022.1 hypothetical protein TVD_06450 [Thioalkalivibrio versutus]